MEHKTLFDDLSECLSDMVKIIDQQAETVSSITRVFESMGTTNVCIMLAYGNIDTAIDFISRLRTISPDNVQRIMEAVTKYVPSELRFMIYEALEGRAE